MDNLALLVILAIYVEHDHWNAEDEKANDHEKQECSDSFDRLLNQKHVERSKIKDSHPVHNFNEHSEGREG